MTRGSLAADADSLGDRSDGQAVVAADHQDPDARLVTARNRIGDGGSGRIEHRHEPEQAELPLRDVPVGRRRPSQVRLPAASTRRPCAA